MHKSNKQLVDKLKGCLIGGALADALGAPYEFRRLIANRRKYSENLIYRAVIPKRGVTSKKLVIGQTTDDTEMAISLLRATPTKYTTDVVIEAYRFWVNGNSTTKGSPTIGRNTSKIFKRANSLQVVKNRLKKLKLQNGSESNGFLMRAGSLVRFESIDIFILDGAITNWGPVSRACSILYGTMLIMAYQGKTKQQIVNTIAVMIGTRPFIASDDVIYLFQAAWIDAVNTTNILDYNDPINTGTVNIRDLKNNQGWCMHAMYCCFNALFYASSYRQAINLTVKFGGDTDTNGCIVGYLFGCLTGYNDMIKDQITKNNIDILMVADYS